MEENTVLIAVGVVIASMFIAGLIRGITGILQGVLCWVVIFGMMFLVTPAIENSLQGSAVEEKFQNSVESHIKSQLAKLENKSETLEELTNTTEVIDLSSEQSTAELFDSIEIPLPEVVDGYIAKQVKKSKKAEKTFKLNKKKDLDKQLSKINQTIAQQASGPIVHFMLRGAALLVSSILAIILTRLLSFVLSLIAEMPVIGPGNRFLGGCFGIIEGCLIVWIIFDVITCFVMTPRGQELYTQIQSDTILRLLYAYNPLDIFVSI